MNAETRPLSLKLSYSEQEISLTDINFLLFNYHRQSENFRVSSVTLSQSPNKTMP